MNLLPLLGSLLDCLLQLIQRKCFFDADFLSSLFQRRLRAHPYDIFDIHVIPENDVPVLIDIYNACKGLKIESEKIKERAVLPEMVRICRIIHRRFLVSQKKNQAGLKLAF
jgi:hypothetical protein